MSLAPSGVVTVNARSHGPATAGSCFMALPRSKKSKHNACLGRLLPTIFDTAEVPGEVFDKEKGACPIVGLIASSVGKAEGRAGMRPAVALHIGGAKTCPRQLVSSDVLPGRPVVMWTGYTEGKKRKRSGGNKNYAKLRAAKRDEKGGFLFATCISGGATDSSIDVVLGGRWNTYIRGHHSYEDKYSSK
jgi:hypothetical protein